jgi:hypothetical protein
MASSFRTTKSSLGSGNVYLHRHPGEDQRRYQKKPLSNVKLGEIEKKLYFPLRIIHGVTKYHAKDFNTLTFKRLNPDQFSWKTVLLSKNV